MERETIQTDHFFEAGSYEFTCHVKVRADEAVVSQCVDLIIAH